LIAQFIEQCRHTTLYD